MNLATSSYSSLLRTLVVGAFCVMAASCGRTAIGQHCQTDDQCPEGGQCVGSICVGDDIPDADGDDADVTPIACESDLDCGSGVCEADSADSDTCERAVCDLEVGVCVNIACELSCDEGSVQLGCRCVPEVCESDAQCDGLICDEGQCRGCLLNDECGTNELCQAGECVAGPECNEDLDCRPSEICVEESCVERPECTFGDDCGPQEQCIAGVCQFTPECSTDDDCGPRAECVGEVCQERLCRGNDTCEEGQLCDMGQCIDPPLTHSCIMITGGRLIAPNERIALEAFALDEDGNGVAASFIWSSTNSAVAAIDGNYLVGGTGAGTTEVSAVLAGGDPIQCNGRSTFTNSGLVPGDVIRVVALDMETGRPLSGAQVEIGDQQATTDDEGLALFERVEGAYEVSVFHPAYNYLTVQGVEARDIRLPVSPRSGSGPAAGFTGSFDLSQLNTSGDINVGLAGASVAGDLLDLDLTRLLGDTFTTRIEIPGMGGADVPLPGGLVAYGRLGGLQIDAKQTYYVQGAAGARLAWGLAGRVPFRDLLSVFTSPPENVNQAIGVLLPLFSRFDHAQQPMLMAALPRALDVSDINNNGDTDEWLPDYRNFPEEDLAPSVRQRLSTAVNISNFPQLGSDAASVAVLVGGVQLDGPGFVPLGISATTDEDEDGRPDPRTLFMAPPYGTTVGGRYALLALAFSAEGNTLATDFSAALWNGQSLGTTTRLGTFPGASTLSANRGQRTLSIDADAGPIYRVRMVGEERSWDVWAMGPQGDNSAFSHSVVIPPVRPGGPDFFTRGTVIVDAIRTTVTINDLVRSSGVGLRRAGLVTSSFNRTTLQQ
ncbi:hypothetical protein DL240_06405 [Lujinxingia litoralis]|uniref:BIG2 domain-containing protein n=1 Tax=Lujinxingia litoralis TaxID=2211119 RepID=A0A328CCX0_9DELT|nr:hypothetical protein [Lujinxingia litoralis]RAL23781.1 hypothetical protein DL240_06405 [Lujinxingia litoralis]